MNVYSQKNYPQTPDQVYGQLFIDVQMQKVFPDNKTFVDCTPKRDPAEIVKDYANRTAENFDLNKFVADNFDLPPSPPAFNYVMQEKDVAQHIKNLWSVLQRESDKDKIYSTLLPLPFPYIVPGGRFREIYYWDSYFTMLGLKESGEIQIIENMINNFDYLIQTYGHVPNGNRSYYLSRSQPPYFSLMVELLASVKGKEIYKKYLPSLEKEYAYWMEGASKLKPGEAYKRVVRMKDGTYCNRYWDEKDIPRQESYAKDAATVDKAISDYISTKRFASEADMKRATDEVYSRTCRNLRSAAFSGWDFSNRWFADDSSLITIETTDIIPVDLHCLMMNLEKVIQKARMISGIKSTQKGIYKRANLQKYFWNKKMSFYTDYQFVKQEQINKITLAGLYPLSLADKNTILMSNASKMTPVLKNKLLKAGGLISVERNSHQQWDAPNGWAPLQWMSVWGLERCGQKSLASDIAKRWIKLNTDVYLRTSKLMEKYNVEDINLEAGGGEYPGQDGFGWTNGVLLAMIKKYGVVK